MTDCLFCGIVAGEIPATVVSDEERVLAFADIQPQAPTHVLVITKDHHRTAADAAAADPALLGELVAAAHRVAEKSGVAESGYRLVFNSGQDAHQSVPHVHCHVLGGRDLTWPPG
ncbi:MAG TPA: histidine triad nucleotide-binding protein [Actinocatenispora sp.]